MSGAPASIVERLFRLLLWLYPADLRSRYGEPMIDMLRDLERQAEGRRFGRLALAGRLLLDAATAVPRAYRWERRARRPRPVVIGIQRRRARMTTIRHDFLVALRRMRSSPGFTLIAALTLALGIGANTAIFSVVYGVLLRPIGVADPSSLAVLDLRRAEDVGSSMGLWPAHLVDLRQSLEGRGVVERLSAFIYESVTLHGDQPEEIGNVLMVDGAFFEVFGVEPMRGRVLDTSDVVPDRRGEVCVVSESMWRGRLGGDPEILGRVLILDGKPVTVVGVMPAGVPLPQAGVQLWMPQGWDVEDPRLSGRLNVLARLAPGVPLETAGEVMAEASAELVRRYPRIDGYALTLGGFADAIIGSARPALFAAAGAVGLILLIACANMASLLLSRALVREREIATRRALGAQRRQLMTQLVVESVSLAALGGVLGVAIAVGLHRVLLGLATGLVPRLYDVRLDLPVLAFAIAVTLLTGVIFGLAPAAFAFTRDLAGAMRGAAASSRAGHSGWMGARQLLVVTQVSLAVVLLAASALMVRSLSELRAIDPGFRSDGVGGARIYIDDDAYPDDEHEAAYFTSLLERLRAMPGIAAAGASSGLPMDPQTIDYDLPYTLAGESPEGAQRQAHFRTVTPGYLETLGVPLLRGRPLALTDRRDGEQVALINETFARVAWGGRDPVGETFSIYGGRRELRVVGVVGDVRFHGPGQTTRPAFFVPYTQMTYSAMAVVARAADGGAASAAVARAALEVDRTQPVHSTFALAALERGAVAANRFYTRLLSAFSALALLLAGAGIYGVVSFWVNESRKELGVRLAIGASRPAIVGLVLRRVLPAAAAGLVVGLASIAAGVRVLEPFLFAVRPTDLRALAAVVAVLAAVALAASLMPAFRASRINPVESLRMD